MNISSSSATYTHNFSKLFNTAILKDYGEIIRKSFVTGVTLLLIQSSEKQNMTCFILVRNKSQVMQSLFRKRTWLFYIPLLIAGLVQESG